MFVIVSESSCRISNIQTRKGHRVCIDLHVCVCVWPHEKCQNSVILIHGVITTITDCGRIFILFISIIYLDSQYFDALAVSREKKT